MLSVRVKSTEIFNGYFRGEDLVIKVQKCQFRVSGSEHWSGPCLSQSFFLRKSGSSFHHSILKGGR